MRIMSVRRSGRRFDECRQDVVQQSSLELNAVSCPHPCAVYGNLARLTLRSFCLLGPVAQETQPKQKVNVVRLCFRVMQNLQQHRGTKRLGLTFWAVRVVRIDSKKNEASILITIRSCYFSKNVPF